MVRWLACLLCLPGCIRNLTKIPTSRTGAPVIDTFTATPAQLTSGGTLTLTAHFSGAGSVDGDVGEIQSDTPLTVTPAPLAAGLSSETRTLTLTAVLGSQKVSRVVTFTVLPAPLAPTILADDWVNAFGEGLTAEITALPGLSYTWSINGGTITSRTNTAAQLQYEAGDLGTLVLTCEAKNAKGDTASASRDVRVVGITVFAGIARPFKANDIAVDSSGALYLAERNRIEKLAQDGSFTVFAGPSDPSVGCADGAAASARFCRLISLSRDAAGNLYAVDSFDGGCTSEALRKITPAGDVTTLGHYNPGSSCSTGINYVVHPFSVTAAADGTAYFGDDPAALVAGITRVDGVPFGSPSFPSGDAPTLSVSADGNTLYLGNVESGLLRRATKSGGTFVIAASTAASGGGGDGAFEQASFAPMRHITTAASGKIYVAEGAAGSIRMIENGVVSTIASPRELGRSPLVEVPPASADWSPRRVVEGPDGDLYVLGDLYSGATSAIYRIRLP